MSPSTSRSTCSRSCGNRAGQGIDPAREPGKVTLLINDRSTDGTGKRVFELLYEVKQLAREYYELTEKPLGVTGEIAEYEAARILKVKLSPPRQSGYDAIRTEKGKRELIQIKGRRLTPSSKPSQRIGSIDLEKEWDVVLLVLLDQHFDPAAIYEADRLALTAALTKPGSRARNERGSLAVSQFKAIGSQIWPG